MRVTMRASARWSFLLLMLASTLTSPIGAQEKNDASGLKLILAQSRSESAAPVFTVQFTNSGSQTLSVRIGIMLGNGRSSCIDQVHFLLIAPGRKSLHLELLEGGLISGRSDPLIITLPPGSTFSFPVDLARYFSPEAQIWKLHLFPGAYSLRAEYTGISVSSKEAQSDMAAVAYLPSWRGTLRSGSVHFRIPVS